MTILRAARVGSNFTDFYRVYCNLHYYKRECFGVMVSEYYYKYCNLKES